jgi:hypothetical protein
MPSDRDQLPRHKPHPSKIESVAEEARLDALLPSRPARGKLPSRLDQPQRIGSSSNTSGKRLPFKLTHSSRDQLPSRLDKSRRDQRPSSLNPSRQDRPSKQYFRSTKKNPLISRLDHSQPQQTEHISINPAFASAHDITMATRQTEYELLAPQEQKKQEEWCHVLRTGVYIASSPPLGHHHSYIFTQTHPHSTSTACSGRDKWAQKRIAELGRCPANFK